MATVQNDLAATVKHNCVSCGSQSENHTEPGYLDKWNGITQWTCPDCVIEFRETANNAELAHRHGVSVHQVGDVYDNAPAETLKKWFVAVRGGDFPEIDITAIPLADSANDAYANAVKYLNLERPD